MPAAACDIVFFAIAFVLETIKYNLIFGILMKKRNTKRKASVQKHTLFRVFPERLYGQVLNKFTGEIGINVEYLWNEIKNEDRFIEEFARTYTHEVLHLLIGAIVEDLYFVGEEKTIRHVLSEKWTRKLREYYAKYF